MSQGVSITALPLERPRREVTQTVPNKQNFFFNDPIWKHVSVLDLLNNCLRITFNEHMVPIELPKPCLRKTGSKSFPFKRIGPQTPAHMSFNNSSLRITANTNLLFRVEISKLILKQRGSGGFHTDNGRPKAEAHARICSSYL